MLHKLFKPLSVLLIMLMVMGVLAGCMDKNKTDVAKEEVAKEKNKTEETTKPAETAVPLKDLTLDIWETQGTDFIPNPYTKDNVLLQYVAQKTGVSIGNLFGNGGSLWGPKLTTMVAGNTLPHIVDNRGGGQGPAQFAKLAEGNLIWELTPEMLEKYAPNIWKRVPKNQWEAIKVDGKIYGVPYSFPVDPAIDPNLDPMVASYFSWPKNDVTVQYGTVWVRDDILKMVYPEAQTYDELMKLLNDKKLPIGDDLLDVPIKTTQDYIDFMYKIKALNLKEGDKPVYAYGYPQGDNWPALSLLGADMMGYSNYFYLTYWSQSDQELKFGLKEPIFKQAALVQNRMVRDKVIDPESLVHTAAQFLEKLVNGRYAIVAVDSAGGGDTINAALEKEGKTYRYRPLYEQIPNLPDFPAYVEPLFYNASRGILKTVKEEDVPQVLKWLDFNFSEEYEEAHYWGPKEAGLYEEAADGTRKFKDAKNQKYYVEGQTTDKDINPAELPLQNPIAMMYMESTTKWNPIILNNTGKYTMATGRKFSVDSPHVQGLQLLPSMQMWAPEYANLTIVKKFWDVRQSWEDPFKVVFTAKSDEDFEKKWTAAIKKLDDVGVAELLSEMNKIAKPLADKLKK